MKIIYLLLEISALLGLMIIPLFGPKRKKAKNKSAVELSDWAINEHGLLEKHVKAEPDHHPIK